MRGSLTPYDLRDNRGPRPCRQRRRFHDQRRARRRRVLHLVEEVRVDPEGRRRARVPELAGDEHHVEPLGDDLGTSSPALTLPKDTLFR
jgi:hypothetical protein